VTGLRDTGSGTRTSQSGAREYECGRCGTRLRDRRWVYSHTTGFRYCVDIAACARRAARRREEVLA